MERKCVHDKEGKGGGGGVFKPSKVRVRLWVVSLGQQIT